MAQQSIMGETGAAYIFAKKNNEWVQEAKLTSDDPSGNSYFGFSVAIHNDYAVVGTGSTVDLSGVGGIYNLRGSFIGDLSGNLVGPVTGDVSGNVTGDLTGDVSGNVTGDLTGDVTGDVTGTVSSLSNHNTDTLSEGSTNLYHTTARTRSSIGLIDYGGDGSMSYNSSTGLISYNGPSASETRQHLSGGTGVTFSSSTGVISIGQPVATTSDVEFNKLDLSDDLTGADATFNTVDINTLRVNNTNVTTKFSTIDASFNAHDTRLDNHDTHLSSIDNSFNVVDVSFNAHETRLDNHDTHLTSVDNSFNVVDVSFNAHETRLDNHDTHLSSIDNSFNVVDVSFNAHETRLDNHDTHLSSIDNSFNIVDVSFNAHETRLDNHDTHLSSIDTSFNVVDASFNITDTSFNNFQNQINTKAPIANPNFTGTPTISNINIATTTDITTAIDNLVDSAPGALNTLNELAAALGDDQNFSTTITNSIATKEPTITTSTDLIFRNLTLSGDLSGNDASFNNVEINTLSVNNIDVISKFNTIDNTLSTIDTSFNVVDVSFNAHETRLDNHDTHLSSIDNSFNVVDVSFNAHETRLDNHDTHLSSIDNSFNVVDVSFNAHETRLDNHDTHLTSVDTSFNVVDVSFNSHETRLDNHDTHLTSIDTSFNVVDVSFNSHETRLDNHDTHLTSIDTSFNVVDVSFNSHETRLDDHDTHLSSIDNSFNIVDASFNNFQTQINTKAPITNPNFTGTPTISNINIATTTDITTAIDNLVDSAPGALNTLNELAAALGDDQNFSTTITNSIATKQSTITTSTDLSFRNLTLSGDISANDASFNAVIFNSAEMAGHILPTSNATYDLGSAEYKIRHLFLSDNSLWIGDDHKLSISEGKMQFRKRRKDKLPVGIENIPGASLEDAKTLLGKDINDTFDNFKLNDWVEYSRLKGEILDIDDIIRDDDIVEDGGLVDNISGQDLSLNNISGFNLDLSGALYVDTINEKTDSSGVTIDSVLLKDNRVTAHTISAQNYAVGTTNFVSASRQGNFRDLEIKSGSNQVTFLADGDSGDLTLNGTLSVDTINEKTDSSGVTIESVLLKDQNVTAHTISAQNYAVGTTNFISASRQGNFRDLEVKNSNNTETILLTGDGGDISINGTLSADTINEKTDSSGVTIESVLLKDQNITAHTISAQNYAVGGTNFISASRQGNFRDLEVKNSSNTETILLTGDGGDISINGTLSADTINEKTSANGVEIEGILFKDNDISGNDASFNSIESNTLTVNNVDITGKLSTIDASFNSHESRLDNHDTHLTTIDNSFNIVDTSFNNFQTQINTKAPIADPNFTGTPTISNVNIATTTDITTAIDNLVDSAPGALNTLNELASALGDDANFSTTITNSLAGETKYYSRRRLNNCKNIWLTNSFRCKTRYNHYK